MSGKSLLSLIPGYDDAIAAAGDKLGHIQPSFLEGNEHLNVQPLVLLCIALVAIFAMAFAGRAKLINTKEAVVPDDTMTIRTFWELFLDGIIGMMEDIMGARNARQFFPLIATCAVVILFSNFLGLMPGMAPPTDSFNVNFAMAGVVFVATHYAGFKVNGFGHLKHMMNPAGLWWAWALAPLMLLIEMISHFVRPVSLALRLMCNMIGDHAVLGQFLNLIDIPAAYPMPIMVLGIIVCIVQTAVFSLLSMVYIGLAAEDQHDH